LWICYYLIYYKIQQRVVFIPNGVNISASKHAKYLAQICYVSRVDKRHASVILLMIQKVLPRLIIDYPMVTINIIGEGNFLDIVREEAAKLNKMFDKEICIISGYKSDVTSIFHDSKLVIGVGRVALEALACGTSVLLINNKRMGTLVSTENYSFYKSNNFVAVGEAPPGADAILFQLQNFFSDFPHWQKETDILQKKVDEEFNNMKIADKIESLYNELFPITK